MKSELRGNKLSNLHHQYTLSHECSRWAYHPKMLRLQFDTIDHLVHDVLCNRFTVNHPDKF